MPDSVYEIEVNGGKYRVESDHDLSQSELRDYASKIRKQNAAPSGAAHHDATTVPGRHVSNTTRQQAAPKSSTTPKKLAAGDPRRAMFDPRRTAAEMGITVEQVRKEGITSAVHRNAARREALLREREFIQNPTVPAGEAAFGGPIGMMDKAEGQKRIDAINRELASLGVPIGKEERKYSPTPQMQHMPPVVGPALANVGGQLAAAMSGKFGALGQSEPGTYEQMGSVGGLFPGTVGGKVAKGLLGFAEPEAAATAAVAGPLGKTGLSIFGAQTALGGLEAAQRGDSDEAIADAIVFALPFVFHGALKAHGEAKADMIGEKLADLRPKGMEPARVARLAKRFDVPPDALQKAVSKHMKKAEAITANARELIKKNEAPKAPTPKPNPLQSKAEYVKREAAKREAEAAAKKVAPALVEGAAKEAPKPAPPANQKAVSEAPAPKKAKSTPKAQKPVETPPKPKTETITPANDKIVGKNAAGETLHERPDGSRYRMRRDRKDRPNGYPDFGGDLAPVEAPPEKKLTPEPKPVSIGEPKPKGEPMQSDKTRARIKEIEDKANRATDPRVQQGMEQMGTVLEGMAARTPVRGGFHVGDKVTWTSGKGVEYQGFVVADGAVQDHLHIVFDPDHPNSLVNLHGIQIAPKYLRGVTDATKEGMQQGDSKQEHKGTQGERKAAEAGGGNRSVAAKKVPQGQAEVVAKTPEEARGELSDWIKKQPQGKVYTKAADLYQAYRVDHPTTTREQFGQMLHDLSMHPDWEVVRSTSEPNKAGVFKATDSSGVERPVIGVRPKAKTAAPTKANLTSEPKPVSIGEPKSKGEPMQSDALSDADRNAILSDIDNDIARHREKLNQAQSEAAKSLVERNLSRLTRERQALIAPELESTRYDTDPTMLYGGVNESYSLTPEQQAEIAKIKQDHHEVVSAISRRGRLGRKIQDTMASANADKDRRIQAVLDKAEPYDAAFERRQSENRFSAPAASEPAPGSVTIPALEASTIGSYLPDDHPLVGKLMNLADKSNRVLTPEQAAEIKGLLDKSNLDKSAAPTLYPEAAKPKRGARKPPVSLEGAKAEERGGKFYIRLANGELYTRGGRAVSSVSRNLTEGMISDMQGAKKQTAKDAALRGQGPQELHAGIPIDRLVRAALGEERYDIAAEKINEFREATLNSLDPSRGVSGAETAQMGRDYLAQREREAYRRESILKPIRAEFDRAPAAKSLRFIDRMEKGATQTGTIGKKGKSSVLADTFRTALDQKRDEVRALGTGKLENFIDNYFPHYWKDVKRAKALWGEGRRPLEGSKGFLKQRTIPTTLEGMFPKGVPANLDAMTDAQIKAEVKKQGGLEPITYNPAELAQLKLQEMDRYIFGQKWFAEMKDQGIAIHSSKLVKMVSDMGIDPHSPAGKQIIDSYKPINDRIAKSIEYRPTVKADGSQGAPEIIDHGQWLVPEAAARVINNHLSPGLDHPVIRAAQYVNNAMNMAQLGLSGFHATTTAMNSIVGENARALDALLSGKPITAARRVLTSPVAPIRDFYVGSKVLAEYRNAGTGIGDIPAVVDNLIKGGGRVTLAKEFRLDAMEAFGKSVRKGDIRGVVGNALPAAMESTMAPLMRVAVPRIKLGAFAELMRDEIAKNPGMSVAQQRHIAARAWDSIENRFGQLNYDNLFWDHAFRDSLHLATRSLGWNLGTIREIGGGAKDLLETRSRLSQGDRFLTPRMAYTASLVFSTAMFGAIYGYLHGRPPKELEDYVHPVGPDGERVDLPGYYKDVEKYANDPLRTVWGKKSPIAESLIDTFSNKDFYGKEIRNRNDPAVKQMQEYSAWALKQFVPFSLEQRRKGESRAAQFEQMLGITPHPHQKAKGGKGELTAAGKGEQDALKKMQELASPRVRVP